MDPHSPQRMGPWSISPKLAMNSGEIGGSAGLRIESFVAVFEEQDSLYVGLGFFQPKTLEKLVELGVRPGLAPELLDSVWTTVVSGQSQLMIAIEHVEHLAVVASTKTDTKVWIA